MQKKVWSDPEFCNLGIENTLGDPDSTVGNDDVYVDATISFTYNGKDYTRPTKVNLGLSV